MGINLFFILFLLICFISIFFFSALLFEVSRPGACSQTRAGATVGNVSKRALVVPASVPGGRRFSDFLRGEVPWRNFFCLLLLLFLLLLERLEVLLVLLCAHLFGSALARAVGILHGSGGAEELQA